LGIMLTEKLKQITFKKLLKANLYGVFFTIILLLFSSCSGTGSGDTLASLKKDINFTNDVHQKLPVPKNTSYKMSLAKNGKYMAMVQINASYPEVLEFYPKKLKDYGWEIVEEDIPEETVGERTATWKVKGHGTKGAVDFTAFGEENGMNMSANYFFEKDE